MNQPPSPEDQARQRFIVLTAIRFTGVFLVIFGVAIVAGKIDLPEIAGYALIIVGAFESLILPLVLIKGWNSPRQ